MGWCKGDEISLTPNHPALRLQERVHSPGLMGTQRRLKTHHGPLTKQSLWNRRRSTPASSSGRRLGSKQNRRAGGRVYSARGHGSESERFHEWGGTEFPPEPIDGEHTHITYMKRKHSHNTYTVYYICNTMQLYIRALSPGSWSSWCVSILLAILKRTRPMGSPCTGAPATPSFQDKRADKRLSKRL